jgi:hypothetical protein
MGACFRKSRTIESVSSLPFEAVSTSDFLSIAYREDDENKIIIDKFLESQPFYIEDFDPKTWAICELNSLVREVREKEKNILMDCLPFPTELISLIFDFLGLLQYQFQDQTGGIIEPSWSKNCSCIVPCARTDWFYPRPRNVFLGFFLSRFMIIQDDGTIDKK